MLNLYNNALTPTTYVPWAGPTDAGVETHQARRGYPCAAGGFVDVPGDASGDAAQVAGNVIPNSVQPNLTLGLFIVGTSGPTTARPTMNLKPGIAHVDTTLNLTVFYDGANWRNPATGAVA
jgi:hypothetical protein